MATPAGPGLAASHPYTCNTCMVAFKNSDLQRGHMQSDWHRYNLKRRVASLPPLSSDIFTEKVLANQATAAATAAKASFERLCSACSKTYFSENAFQNHLKSQKHKRQVALQATSVGAPTDDDTNSVMSSALSLGDTDTTVDARPAVVEDEVAEEEFSQIVSGIKNASIDTDVVPPKRPGVPTPRQSQMSVEHPLSPSDDDQDVSDEQDEDDEVALQKCLFCNGEAQSLPLNMLHMQRQHGMFVPERSYLVDLEGLVGYLHDRVHTLHECLFCGIIKHTTSGIQTHMRDKGHCMIAFDSEEQMVEVGQFYDFRSTYSDDESEEDSEDEAATEKPKRVRLGANKNGKAQEDDEEMAGGEGWETDDSEDETTSTADPVAPKKSKKSAARRDVYFDEDGLHLPSGRTAGHRSLAKYFRQNLHNYALPEERAAQRAAITNGDESMQDGEESAERSLTYIRPRDHQPKALTRANGGLGMVGVSDDKKKEAKVLERQDRRRAQRAENRYRAGNEKRANHQQHFRDPLLQ